MKKSLFLFVLASLVSLTACGSGNGSGNNFGNGGGSSQTGFSNSTLSGSYTFQISGFNTNGFFVESAVFAADGKGNVGNGTLDLVPGSPATGTFTGGYTIASDGTGFLTLNISGGGSIGYNIVMASPTKFYLTVGDGSADASGVGEQQTASALSAVANGTYTFKIHTSDAFIGSSQVSIGQIGAMTVSSGAFTGSENTLILGGSANATTFTGAFNAPTPDGRGSGTLNDSNGTLTFQYYIVNANTINIMPVAFNAVSVLGSGRAELQSGGPFSASSLSGNYAFGSKGDTVSSGINASMTVGSFTAGGNGTISAGAQDFARDGNSTVASDSFTGSYTVAGNGGFNVSLTSGTLGAVNEILWPVSPTRFFFLINDTTKVEDGTIDAQTSSPFSTSSLTGASAGFMTGFFSGGGAGFPTDRLITFDWNNGNVTANVFEIDNGTIPPGGISIPTTYSVAGNGRVAMSVAGLPSFTPSDLVIYLISNGNGYILQNDSGAEMNGTMTAQAP
jgi:hypothetical protein